MGFTLKRNTLSMLVAALAVPAFAQQQLAIEEIIVTAQKKLQTVQDVPVSMNVMSGSDFADVAGFEFADIDRMTAGLDVRGDSFDTNLVLRGLGTDLSASVSPRVTVYLDGAYVASEKAVFNAQYDLQRFEVLRGPQGTLYGKASPAGAITIQTQNPSLVGFDGYVKQSVWQRDGTNTQFGASMPIIEDVLGVRVAGVYDYNRNNDITNTFFDTDASKQTESGRVTLLFTPGDSFTSRLSYQYQEYYQDYYEVLDGSGAFGDFDYRDREASSNIRGFVEMREQHAIWENTFSFGDHELTSVTFYQEESTERLDDRDITPAPSEAQFVGSNRAADWNQELRLSSTGNEFWDYIVGVYYAHSDSLTNVVRDRSGGFVQVLIDPKNSSEDWGVFTHQSFHLTDRTTLTAGLRWTRESRNNSSPLAVLVGGNVVQSFNMVAPENRKRNFYAWTGTIKLQHNFTDDVMGYATYDRGFRAGSSNVVSEPNLDNSLAQFGEETSNNFEVGVKAEVMDGAGQINAALYYQVYKDFQYQADNVPFCDEVTGGACSDVSDFSAVVLADEVVSQGVEIEGRFLLTENWSLLTSVSYNDTKFEEFNDAPCSTGAVPSVVGGFSTCDKGGERVGIAPNWSGVINTEYSLPLGSTGMDWYIRGLYKVESFNRDPVTLDRLGGFGTTDVFTGLRSQQGWEVSLWAKNLFDKDALLDSGFVAGADGYRSVRVTDPRTIGVSASYRWE